MKIELFKEICNYGLSFVVANNVKTMKIEMFKEYYPTGLIMRYYSQYL
jgi:uncharacterized protein YutD